MIPIIKIKIEQRGTLMIININKTIIRNRHQQGIIIIKTTTIRKMMTTTMTITTMTMTPSDEETAIPAAKLILIKPQTNSNHHS